MRTLTLALFGLLSGNAAFADGDALVIGNSTYNGVQTLFGATQIVEAAEALRGQGFDVAEARDADAGTMDAAFASFVSGLAPDAGPVVVLLAGSFLHGANGAYLLPARDGAALADSVVLVEAFPVDAVLSVLAQYPGQAFLVAGESAVEAVTQGILSPGLGDVELPSGVTLLRGAEVEVARFASGELAKSDVMVVAAAKAAGLTVEGFAPRDLMVVKGSAAAPAAESAPVVEAEAAVAPPAEPDVTPAAEPDVTPAAEPEVTPAAEPEVVVAAEPEAAVVTQAEDTSAAEVEMAAVETVPDASEAAETTGSTAEAEEPEDARSEVEIAADNAAWRAARIDNSEASYTAYLDAQPEGSYLNAAKQRLKAIRSDPYYELRRAEDFLGLNRDARRQIQRDLDVLDLYHWGVDGIFGDGTRDAIRAWQAKAGVQETGYLDLNQIASLEADAKAQREADEAAENKRLAEAAAEARRQREAAAAAAAAAAASQENTAQRSGPSDSSLWREVERLGSEEAVRRYLRSFPNGERSRQARQILQVIERMRGG